MKTLTVSELKAELEKLEKYGHGSDGVTVHTFGVIAGGNAQVTGISAGFDWTSGQAVINTVRPVQYYKKASLKEEMASLEKIREAVGMNDPKYVKDCGGHEHEVRLAKANAKAKRLLSRMRNERKKFEEKLRSMRASLDHFGKHKQHCSFFDTTSDRGCDCGLWDASNI